MARSAITYLRIKDIEAEIDINNGDAHGQGLNLLHISATLLGM